MSGSRPRRIGRSTVGREPGARARMPLAPGTTGGPIFRRRLCTSRLQCSNLALLPACAPLSSRLRDTQLLRERAETILWIKTQMARHGLNLGDLQDAEKFSSDGLFIGGLVGLHVWPVASMRCGHRTVRLSGSRVAARLHGKVLPRADGLDAGRSQHLVKVGNDRFPRASASGSTLRSLRRTHRASDERQAPCPAERGRLHVRAPAS